MAQKTIIKLVDDLDHEEIKDDGQTIRFAYKSAEYEIDLSEKNVKKLEEALAPFLAAARRTGGRPTRDSTANKAGKGELAAMRAWAKQHGMKVSDRGRVSREVQSAYHAAN
jgi:hypothetical protein